MIARWLVCLILTLLPTWPAQAAPDPYRSVWECDNTKFSWYCDEEEEQKKPAPEIKPPTPIPAPKPKPKPKSIKEMTSTKEVDEEIKRLLSVATMSPTDENVKNLALAVEYIKSKASVLSDVWRRLAWQTQELNPEGQRPANTVGLETYNKLRDTKKVQSLANLAKSHGLFFFFKSDCPYCHKLAPILKIFQARHGMEIFPVSLDARGLPDFPAFETDRGIARSLGVDRWPALFLADKATGDIRPIAFGIISLNELEERVYVLTQTKPGEEL
jgi:conjugal transfer pilus assembly protein TraF